MRLIYKGSPAKSPLLGRLIRGKQYEISSKIGNQFLADKINWENVGTRQTMAKKEEKEMTKHKGRKYIYRGGEE